MWLIFILVLIITSLLIASLWLKPTPRVSPNAGVPGLTTTENNAIASKWATDLLQKYPYLKDSFSGIIPTKSQIEVWIIGKKIADYDPKMVGVENNTGRYFAKLIDAPIYTKQAGDTFDERIPVVTIKSSEIKAGDYIALRATYLDNGILTIEVRKLLRE